VRVGIWDASVTQHVDFGNRVHVQEYEDYDPHGTHVTGTILGAGLLNPDARGMAPAAHAYTHNFNTQKNGLSAQQEMAIAKERFNIALTQNSYGIYLAYVCSRLEQIVYSASDYNLDLLANRYPTLQHVFAAGNDQASCGGQLKELYGQARYFTASNRSKNSIHVGAVDRYGDMTDSSSLVRIIQLTQPDEIYNLAAQSHVKVSFDVPEYTADADAIGTLRLLEAVRILGMEHKTRIYQASTSELFGLVQEVPQRETTPFYPRSPYSVAKQYGFWITKNYRESYGMFAVNGILFNHESERRGENFVTRKITLAAARIVQGFQDKLYMGNLNALRDWGYAKDYVECMWMMLQYERPEDFVIATGEMHTVREFCTLAFREAGIELRWEGEGLNERGIDVKTGRSLVEVDPKYFRPAEVEQLLGDPTKAKTLLGWNPRKTSFEELVRLMVKHDMRFTRKLYLRAQEEE